MHLDYSIYVRISVMDTESGKLSYILSHLCLILKCLESPLEAALIDQTCLCIVFI